MNQSINHLINHKLVPVFYNDDAQWCVEVMDICYKNGIRVFEFTNRGEYALSNFSKMKKFQQENFPEMMLGAGTVFDKKAATDFIAQGASFIVSPCFVGDVLQVCKNNKIVYLPGCMTVREIFDANRAGCEMVKIFPGNVLGPAFVKAVKAVLPEVKLMVTGGVDEDNMNKWLTDGADVVGTGALQSIELGKYDKLEAQIKSLQSGLQDKKDYTSVN